jgi:arylsulfatase A-like enzyme
VVPVNRRLSRTIAVAGVGIFVAAACSDQGDIAALPDEVPAERTTTTVEREPDIDGPNVLIVIADDLGADLSPCYAADAVSAPTIEALCQDGVVFDQAWSMPVSSPTRAAILTGRYGYRTGVGDLVQRVDDAISRSEFTLPQAVEAADLPHATANFGNWDLGDNSELPNLIGWDWFSGLLHGSAISYDTEQKVVNGTTQGVDDYLTTDNVNDAIDWISHRDKVPWLIWLAFNAPHEPFHLPPTDLHEFDDLSGLAEDISADPRPYYDAALQALDTELGRLLESIEPQVLEQTTIIFISDNGSPSALYPVEVDEDGKEIEPRLAGTLYEGGVHIPFVIAGNGVTDPGRRSDALVHTVDLFSTVLDLLGTSADEVESGGEAIDSVSLTPILDGSGGSVRTRLYAERFGPTGDRELSGVATRDERYKVIQYEDGSVEAYDLVEDPLEETDIYLASSGETRAQLDTLLAELEAVRPFELVTAEEP